MLKLIGKALAHSFGLVAMVLVATIGGTITYATHGNFLWLLILTGIYTGGYALLPLAAVVNKLAEGAAIRKEIKKEMNTSEWAKDFKYEMSKKAQKKIDKINIKKAKKGAQNAPVAVIKENKHEVFNYKEQS